MVKDWLVVLGLKCANLAVDWDWHAVKTIYEKYHTRPGAWWIKFDTKVGRWNVSLNKLRWLNRRQAGRELVLLTTKLHIPAHLSCAVCSTLLCGGRWRQIPEHAKSISRRIICMRACIWGIIHLNKIKIDSSAGHCGGKTCSVSTQV